MFQTDFPSIKGSSKLHIQCRVFVRPILLPAASLARLAAGSSIGLTNTRHCMCSFELLLMEGKPVRNMKSVLRKQIKCGTLHLVGCTLRIYRAFHNVLRDYKIYNKKTKGPTLMKLFTATGK